jgi:hypothetical protein
MKYLLPTVAACLLALAVMPASTTAGQGARPVVHTQEIEVQENGFASVNLPQSPTVPVRVELRASYSIEWLDTITAGETPATVIASWDYPERGGLPSTGDYGTFGDTFVDLDVRAFGMRSVARVSRIIQTVLVQPGETGFLGYDGGAFVGVNSTTDPKVIANFVGDGEVFLSYVFTSEDHLAGGSNASIQRSTTAAAAITVIYYYE